jgi:hypothetical protein
MARVLVRMAAGMGPLAFQALRSATLSASGRRIRRRVARLASTHCRGPGLGHRRRQLPAEAGELGHGLVGGGGQLGELARPGGAGGQLGPAGHRRPTRAASCQSTSRDVGGRAVETTAAPGRGGVPVPGYASAPVGGPGRGRRQDLGPAEPGPEAHVERDQARARSAPRANRPPAGPVDGRAADGRRGGRAGRLHHRAPTSPPAAVVVVAPPAEAPTVTTPFMPRRRGPGRRRDRCGLGELHLAGVADLGHVREHAVRVVEAVVTLGVGAVARHHRVGEPAGDLEGDRAPRADGDVGWIPPVGRVPSTSAVAWRPGSAGRRRRAPGAPSRATMRASGRRRGRRRAAAWGIGC